jgi:hypothetical protein
MLPVRASESGDSVDQDADGTGGGAGAGRGTTVVDVPVASTGSPG